MIAQVVFNLPLDRPFDYLIPETWAASLQPGMRVVAPFGARRLPGMVVGLHPRSPIRHLKTLHRVLDPQPLLTPEGMRLAQWLARAYACSLGEACATMVPGALRLGRVALEEVAESAERSTSPQLTDEQDRAFHAILAPLHARRHGVFLVHGVTGSGKTELYLQLMAQVLAQGRGAICLVPEIALTPQIIERFRARFGSAVALWHSRLTARQRGREWQRILAGRSRIVVGTRSAVWLPVASPGLIVLDEEHDASYKQDQSPRYHAREAALARARLQHAVVVLGSATPSIESYYHATRGTYHLLPLTRRVEGRPLPAVEVVDLRQEFLRRHHSLFSPRLLLALRRTVELNEQAILLLNRRGFARVAQCQACGAVMRCAQCAVPLVYHANSRQLRCHYCAAQQALPEACPSCRKGYLRLRGSGTERVESEMHRLFPAASIARMDTDTTKARDSHDRLYAALKGQQVGVLVGTQMVAKGHDFPDVTLVGVVSADTALTLPDFRAGEQTFSLLTQAAGRAGRGNRPGQVIIQTYCPSHYAIQAASRHDYEAFYRAELRMRKRLRLPPFSRLIELTVQGHRAPAVQAAAEALAQGLSEAIGRRRIELLGPAPHRIVRLRRTVRWQLVLKGARVEPMLELLRGILGEGRRFRGLPVLVDVDPL